MYYIEAQRGIRSLNHRRPIVYVISDSVGETAELVARAAASQFGEGQLVLRRVSHVHNAAVMEDTLQDALDDNAVVAFTIVIPELREVLLSRTRELGIPVVDILSPMMDALQRITDELPLGKPGLVHQLNAAYFRRVEAIEFAVKYDDGHEPRGLHRADIVIIGVSRTSKTPLSIYLAHKGFKVANVPLVPEVDPTEILLGLPYIEKIVGLTIRIDKLVLIRQERLRAQGLMTAASYASHERILEELEHASSVMKRLRCPIIDVTDKAVEETAGLILEYLTKRGIRG